MGVFVFTAGGDIFVGDPAQTDFFIVGDIEFLTVAAPADSVVADPDNPDTLDILVLNTTMTTLSLSGGFLAITGIEQISFGALGPYSLTLPDNDFINQNANADGTLTFDGRDQGSITIDAGAVTNTQRSISAFLSVGSDSVIGTHGDDDFIQLVLAGDSLSGGDDTLIGGVGNDIFSIDISDLTANDLLDGGTGIDGIQLEGSWALTTGTGVLAGVTNVEDFIFGVGSDGTRTLVATNAYVTSVGGTLFIDIANQQTQPLTVDASALSAGNHLQVIANRGASPDTIIGGAGSDTLVGGDGNDSLRAGGGDYVITGDAGNDTIDLTGAGQGSASGGADNDVILGGAADLAAALTLDGGAGTDTLQLASPGLLNLASLNVVTGLEQLVGSSGNDTIVGTTQQLDAFTTYTGGLGTDVLATTGTLFDLTGHGIGGFEFLSTTNTVGTVFRLQPGTLINVLQGVLGGSGFDTIQFVDQPLTSTTSTGGFAGTVAIERLELNQPTLSGGAQSLVLTDPFLSANGLVSGATRTLEISPGTAIGIIVDGTNLTVATNNLVLGNSPGDDTLIGGPGNDQIDLSSGGGTSGSDVIIGGGGNDTIFLDNPADLTANDSIDGGNGYDRLSITGGSFVDLRTASAFINMEEVDGHDNGLTLILAANANLTAVGGAGADVIAGRAGAESILGGNGADTLFGGNGADTLIGGDGNDVLVGDDQGGFPGGQPAGDVLDGGTGNDQLFGEDGADTLTGGAGTDILVGGTGNDSMSGGDDDDTLFGSQGSDTISGDDGNDVLVGFQSGTSDPFGTAQTDPDTLNGGGGADTLFGGGGGDSLSGGDGNDALLGFGGADRLDGGGGNDQLVGYLLISDPDADTLIGGGGNDSLFAGGGADSLSGGDGSDFLLGDDGADTLDGGGGNDFLIGGAGADRFRFAPSGGSDLIIDFVRGDDRADLSAFGLAGPAAIGTTVTVQLLDNAVRLQFPTGELLTIVGITDVQTTDYVF